MRLKNGCYGRTLPRNDRSAPAGARGEADLYGDPGQGNRVNVFKRSGG